MQMDQVEKGVRQHEAEDVVNIARIFGVTASSRHRTRVSFDVDDTLACHPARVAFERGCFPAFMHRWFGEPLRFGTSTLMRELRRRNCSVWIYTTSGRSESYIRRWLLLHGIRIDGVINSARHRHEVASHRLLRVPSKYPPAFGIDLHVDDSEGVEMEGAEHGFRVVLVRPDDPHWTQRVLDAVTTVQMTCATRTATIAQ